MNNLKFVYALLLFIFIYHLAGNLTQILSYKLKIILINNILK